MKDRRKSQYCLCGFPADNDEDITEHKISCGELREMFYREIIRIQSEIGRFPTTRDYQSMADKSLPSLKWVFTRWGAWSQVVGDLERDEHRNALIAAAKKEIVRISKKLATSYAPTKNMYKEQKLKGAPTAKVLLKEFSLSEDSDGWREFVEEFIGMEVETPAARAARKERLDTCDTVAPVKIIDETGMAMQADGMPVYKVIERPHETVYMLR